MRRNILAAGVILLAVALLFGLSDPFEMLFTVPVSILNIVLGLIIRAPPRLDLQPETSSVRLIIDRGVVRASVYQIVFLDSKLIMKRLSSVTVTVVLALLLTLVGLALLFIIGAIMGGITGFSLQEYLTQRARDRIGTGSRLTQTEKNDIEINMADIQRVKLVRNRLYLTTERTTLVASFPRGYSAKLQQPIEKLFGSKLATEDSIRTAKAS